MVDISISNLDSSNSRVEEDMASEIIIILPNHLYPVRIPPKPLSISSFLCMHGLFQPGWNSVANNGNSSGSPTTTHVALSQKSVSPRPIFSQSSSNDLQTN